MIDKTDVEIIEEIKAGNTSAYTILLDRYKHMVFTLAFNILLNREDAEELAQDVFVKAFHALPSFKGESLFSTWLYRIVINTSLNKKKLNRIQFSEFDKDLNDNNYDGINDLLHQQEINERKNIVQSAIQLLKENERLCITLFYLNELSLAEINELSGITIPNIKILLHRARKSLHIHLSALLKNN